MNTVQTPQNAPTPQGLGEDGRSTRWSQHRSERRRALLYAAMEAVHRHGSEVSMDEIARLARTSKPTFYRYFGDKAGLGRALGEYLLDRLRSHIEDAVRQAESPEAVVHGMIETYLMMVQRSPAVHEFVTTQSGLAGRTVGAVSGAAPTQSLDRFADHVSSLLVEALARASPPVSLPRGGPRGPSGEDLLTACWARSALGSVLAATEHWLAEQSTAPGRGQPTGLSRETVVQQLTHWVLAPVLAPGPGATPDAGTTADSPAPGPARSH